MEDGWFYCERQGCHFKSLSESRYWAHVENAHVLDDDYYNCNRVGCKYRTKYEPALTAHLAKCTHAKPVEKVDEKKMGEIDLTR